MSVEWDPSDFNRNLLKTEGRRMLDSVLIVERAAKRRAPKKTAHLASTITHQLLINQGNVRGFALAGGQSTFGTLVDYAIWQEIGTKYMTGRFYMRGGLRESFPAIRKIWGIV